MYAVVIALLRTRYPAITTSIASDAYLESWGVWAEEIANPEPWGTRWVDGMVLLLAHRVRADGLLTPGGGAAPGPLRSLSTLGMSASWGASPAEAHVDLADADLSTTPEGRAYLQLRATVLDVVMPWGV